MGLCTIVCGATDRVFPTYASPIYRAASMEVMATGQLNPEPFAYESALSARWPIHEQIQGESALNFQPDIGRVRAPLLFWGPYLRADGVTPRTSDGLTYTREDLAAHGTHPSNLGRDKVAQQMLKFFQTDTLAATWFTRSRE